MDKPVSQMTPNEHARYMQEEGARLVRERPIPQSYVPTTTSSATRMPPRPNGQPYFQPGGFSDAKSGVLAAIFAPILYSAFKAASKELVAQGTPQASAMPKAFGHAMSVVWQWKAWAFTLFYWVISGLAILAIDMDTSYRTKLLVLHALLLLPAILLPYCQAVDASFFKQRTLYTLLKPIHAVTSWIPWFVLQSTVLIPLFVLIQYGW